MYRTRVSVLVEKDLDRRIEHLAIDLNKTKSELYELGVRILSELIENGEISKETMNVIKKLRLRAELAAAPSTA